MAITEGFVAVRQGRLRVQHHGQADVSPVVLLHGFSFDSTSWDDQFDAFASSRRTIRYDLRGFGRSTMPTSDGYSHVDDLLAVLKALSTGPAHIVGLSLGAAVALNFAFQHRALVQSLVLVSPGLAGHAWPEARPQDAAKAHAKTQGAEAAKRFWLQHPMFEAAREQPAVAARLKDMIQRYNAWHWKQSDTMRPFEELGERLQELQVPTLIVGGERDVAGYRDIAKVLAAGIPGARLEQWADTGHIANMEQPERFNEKVQEFFAQVDSSRVSKLR